VSINYVDRGQRANHYTTIAYVDYEQTYAEQYRERDKDTYM